MERLDQRTRREQSRHNKGGEFGIEMDKYLPIELSRNVPEHIETANCITTLSSIYILHKVARPIVVSQLAHSLSMKMSHVAWSGNERF